MMGKLPFRDDTTLDQVVGLLRNAGFAHAELAPVPDPYVPEDRIEYIMVQTAV